MMSFNASRKLFRHPRRSERSAFWSYAADGFYSRIMSGAQRLPNGNTLITEGQSGRLIEVTAAGEVVWEYANPAARDGLVKQGDLPENGANSLFRVRKYAPDHPAFMKAGS